MLMSRTLWLLLKQPKVKVKARCLLVNSKMLESLEQAYLALQKKLGESRDEVQQADDTDEAGTKGTTKSPKK
jgi:hypothetical protein